MKSVILTLVQLVCVTVLFAQTEGKIVYEERMDLHRRLPPDRAEMKDMIPQFRSSYYELYYTQDASMYKASEKEQDEEVTGNTGGAQFRMRMTPPRREVYKSLSENKMVDEREFMTKIFLIKGETSPYKWKIADGQKTILDRMCMKATFQDSTNTYTVWFTPQIAVSNGPAEFGGLPGMVMQVDINEGERVITATELTEEPVDATLLKEPTKGKEVTQEEFREIVREKTREMHENGGGGPTIMIRH